MQPFHAVELHATVRVRCPAMISTHSCAVALQHQDIPLKSPRQALPTADLGSLPRSFFTPPSSIPACVHAPATSSTPSSAQPLSGARRAQKSPQCNLEIALARDSEWEPNRESTWATPGPWTSLSSANRRVRVARLGHARRTDMTRSLNRTN